MDLSVEGVEAAIMEALPAGVSGSMDGEKVPMNKVEEIKAALEPYQKKYGNYLSKIRPWRELIRLRRPEADTRQRLETNLTRSQINYAVIFLLLMIVSIVMNPHCVVVICVLALIWMAFLKKNDDPQWEVAIGGVQLGKTQRWMVLTAITAVVLLTIVGHLIFS